MYDNTIITSEDRLLYEKLHKAIREERRETILHKAKQKILGILAIGVGITELALGYVGLMDEGGAFIFMLPIGICLLFSRKEIV